MDGGHVASLAAKNGTQLMETEETLQRNKDGGSGTGVRSCRGVLLRWRRHVEQRSTQSRLRASVRAGGRTVSWSFTNCPRGQSTGRRRRSSLLCCGAAVRDTEDTTVRTQSLMHSRILEAPLRLEDLEQASSSGSSSSVPTRTAYRTTTRVLSATGTTLATKNPTPQTRNHTVLVSLQAMNASLVELKLDQDQTAEVQVVEQLPPLRPLETSDTSALWEAVKRLDNMVVNNTVKVGGLMEDVEVTSGSVQQLRRDLKQLDTQINQTARNGQMKFMETGLEVEAAREVVLTRVEELAANLSQHDMRLQDMDTRLRDMDTRLRDMDTRLRDTEEDVDYVYDALYKRNSSADCDCKALKAAVTRLERGVANVTELVNENRLALEETGAGGAGQWGGVSNWEPTVQLLQHDLQQVKESLASEQTRTRTLDHSLTQLSNSVKVGLAEVSGLKGADGKLQHLSGSFDSLLEDAIRHSDVLELLLGEEVLEFLEWPVQDQEAHSIPALKEQLGNLQEQLRGHNLSITSLLGNSPGGREEVPSADQPSSDDELLHDDWLPGSMRRSSSEVPARERQLLLQSAGRRPELRGDGSDLWNLEKAVEELELKVLRLEEKTSNASAGREAPPGGAEAKLQAEVMWLKRGLEEHLRVFKNVFSNADVLAGSDATLELDKLWQLVKNKEGKKEKKRGGRGNHRSRRETSGVVAVPSGLSEASLLLVAGSPPSVSSGVIVFEASLNAGRSYSDSGTFMAPVNGVYLFVLTLDLRLGPAHVVLTRGLGGAPVSLHRREVTEAGPVTAVSLLPLSQGEDVRLELKGGAWAESEDNVFTVVLLHQTT